MSFDPVVDEVRQARDEIARRFDYNLRAIFEDARKRQAASGRKVVNFPPRPVKNVVKK
jgi:hypothetical protein